MNTENLSILILNPIDQMDKLLATWLTSQTSIIDTNKIIKGTSCSVQSYWSIFTYYPH